MARYESWFKQDLKKPISVQMIQGNLFSADVQGNLIGVEVFDDGEAATMAGTVSANIIRPDGGTVAASGTFSGNKCSVVLPAAAYAYPGVATIAIKITDSGVVTTLLAAVVTIYRTSTDTVVDPGTIMPSIQSLITQIQTAVASIPADYSSLWTTLAPAYTSLTFPVKAGQYCTNGGVFYRAKQDIATSEEFTSSHWDVANIGNELSSLKSAISDLDGNLYTDISVVVGGSKEFSETDTFTHGLGNIRYFSYTSESEYEINKIKIRAYANESTVCKFKLITVEFSGTSVYIRNVSDEFTLEDPTGTFEDYTITLDTPFVVPAGQMVGICGSDSDNNNWLYYSTEGTDVSYYVRTQAYTDIVEDFRLQTYLPTMYYTGRIPITFYSGSKEFIHIYTEEEIEEIAEEAASELSDEIEAVSDRVGELIEDKNTSGSSWQSGVWGNASDASISANSRFISFKTYLDDVDLIINKDITKYKYGIIAANLSATYKGQGWYNPATDSFAKYNNYFITSEIFDMTGIKLKYPNYSFTVSVCHVADTDANVNEYQNISFISYASYNKNYLDHVLPKTVYVASDGDDDNDGHDSNHPVLTINHAIELGATRILLAGGNYSEQIDIGRANGNRISIEALEAADSPVIYSPGCIVAETETAVSGTTKVYSATTEHTFPSTTSVIFLEGVADESTEIDDSDRHPLQRGNFYRCGDTRIFRCTATVLSDALTEIENSDQYKWFYDSGTIYFSRPSTVSASHPLMTGLYDKPLFLNVDSRSCSIEMSGIVIKYARVNFDKFSNARMMDCKVFGACGGGIMYNNSLSVVLQRCDVSGAYSGTLGDGICATGSNTYGQAYGTTVTMIDCWVHDNMDDGFSDHIGCESTIIGGLYEFNGKGGVLPTGGGSCTCYNVTSRNNAIGFEIASTNATDPVASGRNGQQISCFDCIAEENSQYGFFVAGHRDMTMRLVGCKAISNGTGFFGSYNVSTAKMIAIDCGGYGNTTLKQNSVDIVNTTLLSE